jgi:predicted nuclease of predicted toxin-antitoxin system
VSAEQSVSPHALLLDEMFSPVIADELTRRGVDCRAVVADRMLRRRADLKIFEVALGEGRVLVTNNVRDFESLRRARQALPSPVPGLIYTCDASFPRTRAFIPEMVAALEIAARNHAVARQGGVLWLQPQKSELL